MLSVVREEMQSQGMKLVGALLAGIGTGVVPVQRKDSESAETALPEVCEKLPDELSGVLDFIRYFDLVRGTVWGYIHTIAALCEAAFAGNGTDNCKATGWDDPLVGQLRQRF